MSPTTAGRAASAAVHVNTVSNSSARSAASISLGRGRAGSPIDQDPAAGRVEVVEEDLGARVGTRRVVGAVDDHQRLMPEHFETTRHAHVGEAFAHDVVGDRGGEERLDRGRARPTALSPWCLPCSGTNTSV